MDTRAMNSQASVLFTLDWESAEAHHRDVLYTENVNFWRDIFPADLKTELMQAGPGQEVCTTFEMNQFIPAPDARQQFEVKPQQFNGKDLTGQLLQPRVGRFYPRGCLEGIANIFKANIQPFRCTNVSATGLEVDFNHPLAGRPATLRACVQHLKPKAGDRGGSLTDWRENVSEGPGMQARWQGRPTDFFSDAPFKRADEAPDEQFYAQPRLVNHLDSTAIAHLKTLYGQLLTPQSRVLDLMSSWTSHTPADLPLERLSGLGLNAVELQKNADLTDFLVHDLNQDPTLPCATGEYDAIICTASIEYLIQPQAVIQELTRVLRPEGIVAITFSNRWFPPKAIQLWSRLHEFERLGLVSELLLANGNFKDLHTLSIRGYPRPDDDKYANQFYFSDPVYAVWATRG